MRIDARLVKALGLIWEVTHDTFFDQDARSAYWRVILKILGKSKVPLEPQIEGEPSLKPELQSESEVKSSWEPETNVESQLELKHEAERDPEVLPRSQITRNTWPSYLPPHERPKPVGSFGRSKAVQRETAELPHDTSE